MKLFGFLKRNVDEFQKPWEETKAGKDFYEKTYRDALRRQEENEEWEKKTPPERKEQVKYFKIIITACTLIYAAALYAGFIYMKELLVLLVEGCIALVCFLLYKIKPRAVKYPNCFMMPVIAFLFMILFSIYLYFAIGKNIRERQEELGRSQSIENKEDLDDFMNDSYSRWLKENEIETAVELEQDFMKSIPKEEVVNE